MKKLFAIGILLSLLAANALALQEVAGQTNQGTSSQPNEANSPSGFFLP